MRYFLCFLNFLVLYIMASMLSSCNTNRSKINKTNKELMLSYMLSNANGLPIDSLESKLFLKNIRGAYPQDSSALVAYYTILADASSKHFDLLSKQSEQYYQKAISLADREGLHAMKIWSLVNYGFYYYSIRKLDMAMPLFMEATILIDEIGEENVLLPEDVFRMLGFFFGNIGNNEDAIAYLNKAMYYARKITQEQQAMLLDNIGQYQLVSQDTVAALNSFLQAESLAYGASDYVRYGKVLGNIALVYLGRKNYKEALTLINRDLYYSIKYQSDQNTMYARVLKAKILLEMDSVSSASHCLDKAKGYAEAKSYLKTDVFEIQKLKLRIACITGDAAKELTIRRDLELLEEVIMGFDSDANRLQNKWRIDIERNKNALLLAETNIKAQLLRYYIIAIIGGVTLIGLLFLIVHLRRKASARILLYEKKVVDLLLKKAISDKNLLSANETLVSYREYLTEKNHLIKDLQQEIDHVKKSNLQHLEQEKGLLKELMDSHLLTEQNWLSFKRAFDVSYPNFYVNLMSEFPELTDSNMRYLILSKLGLSMTEISNLLGVSTESVKKSRQRIRKKIGDRYKDFEKALYS